jgi:uncharacterized OB-fold protein
VSAFTRPFWDALAEGRLTTTRCLACGSLGFPPRNLCRQCWGRELAWVPLAATGTLYSWTRVHVAPDAFRGAGAYAIGLVDLEDGVRLMCRLLGEPTADDLDRRVEMVVLAYADGPLFAARRIGRAGGDQYSTA